LAFSTLYYTWTFKTILVPRFLLGHLIIKVHSGPSVVVVCLLKMFGSSLARRMSRVVIKLTFKSTPTIHRVMLLISVVILRQFIKSRCLWCRIRRFLPTVALFVKTLSFRGLLVQVVYSSIDSSFIKTALIWLEVPLIIHMVVSPAWPKAFSAV
jgi:hypothetical protein